MSVTYVIAFRVIPAQRTSFLALLHDVLDAMREEATFVEAVLHRDTESPNTFMLYETWEDHDDVLQVQLLRPYRKAWHDALPDLLEGRREISTWQPIRADRAPHRIDAVAGAVSV